MGAEFWNYLCDPWPQREPRIEGWVPLLSEFISLALVASEKGDQKKTRWTADILLYLFTWAYFVVTREHGKPKIKPERDIEGYGSIAIG